MSAEKEKLLRFLAAIPGKPEVVLRQVLVDLQQIADEKSLDFPKISKDATELYSFLKENALE